ncbi:MAG: glycosyltransferase family 2 protein [Clostridiales bacterium]|nr:glycosyltransferase family 2 protein [Clostridiales bacterium]
MDILISLLVPTLGQREMEFKRLLDSFVAQSYQSMEVVVISQDNHQAVENQCKMYHDRLVIKHLKSDIRGLSLARNIGLRETTGDIIVLSDDDCWYPSNAMKSIADEFVAHPEMDVLLTQIYDPIANCPYKSYGKAARNLNKTTDLLSRSSIEIAFRKDDTVLFDELFGVGATYVAGEENDFLIRCLKSKKIIVYKPITTVFHEKKARKESPAQLIAKGAFYAKHFGFIVSNLVLLRDLIIKHQNNFREFWNGYFSYKESRRSS